VTRARIRAPFDGEKIFLKRKAKIDDVKAKIQDEED
jgi:hypothetical protein